MKELHLREVASHAHFQEASALVGARDIASCSALLELFRAALT